MARAGESAAGGASGETSAPGVFLQTREVGRWGRDAEKSQFPETKVVRRREVGKSSVPPQRNEAKLRGFHRHPQLPPPVPSSALGARRSQASPPCRADLWTLQGL